jgi:hypothetical protein
MAFEESNITEAPSAGPRPFFPALNIAVMIFDAWVPLFTFIFGVIGNVTAFIVTTKKGNRKISTCVYMSGLSVVDTTLLVTVLHHKLIRAFNLNPSLQTRLNIA